MYLEVVQETSDTIVIAFKPESLDALKTKIADQFKKDGYVRVAEISGVITYERGSLVGRIFLGAFYKYFKWDVRFIEEAERTVVTINKQASGMWGGLIGVAQVKTELQRIKGVMMNWK